MPAKIVMTDAQAATIRAMRAEGRTWDQIADRLLASRDWVIRRGRDLGLSMADVRAAPPKAPPSRAPMKGGAVLPPGQGIDLDAASRRWG